MKKILSFVLLMLIVSTVRSEIHYVGTGGTFTTIAQVNAHTFVAGDQILFKRGETFSGSLTIAQSGTSGSRIVYGAYGTGANPIITGFNTVSSWINLGSNIWESSSAISDLTTCNMVTIGGVNTAMGRTPNSSWYSIDSHDLKVSVTNNTLTGTPNWTGAEVVVRSSRFTLDRPVVSSQSSGTITFATALTYEPIDGNGFFFQNDIRTLDTQNEWYFNPTTKKLSIYSTSQPSNVKAASLSYMATITGNYITIQDITFTGANASAVYCGNGVSNRISVLNCSFDFSGLSAIKYNGDNLLIEGCTIDHTNDNGIDINSAQRVTIRDNSISNTALIRGAGLSGSPHHTGIMCINKITYALIENNRIINTGFNGMYFYGDSITIQKNYIDTFNSLLEDGGGIYTFTGVRTPMVDMKILDNIVTNGVGAPSGLATTVSSMVSAGIYLDNNSSSVEVARNTIFSSNNVGIYSLDNNNINLHHNNIYDCEISLRITDSGSDGNTYNLTVVDNIFTAKTADQHCMTVRSSYYNIPSMGTFDRNYYARPIDNDSIIHIWPPSGEIAQLLSDWKTYSSQDANSFTSPKTVTDVNDLAFYYNNSNTDSVVFIPQPAIDMAGTKYNGYVTLDPYESLTTINQTAYYVSSSGSDAADGLTPATAWQTLSKASTWLATGSNILFKRGDTFYGTLNMFNSGASGSIKTFGAYGSGANPIITGFTTISGWTNEGSGVYSKIITSDAKTTMVTLDGVQVAMGRYPNTGYRSYEGISTNVSITDTGLGDATNWTGAEVVIRKNDWTLDRCTITNHTGDVLTYTSLGSTQNGTVGYGYFFQNDLRTLDQLGEWVHNTGTGKFYMYFGAVNPDTKVVKVATINNLVSFRSYTNLSNIDFVGCINNAIEGTESYTTTSVTDCNFSFIGGVAISQRGTSSTVLRNTITNSTKGVYTNRPLSIISDNTFSNIGLLGGVSTTGLNNAIEIGEDNNITIERNSIVNVGYNGIKIGSYGSVGTSTVKNNYIDNYCTLVNDGGGIYTGGTHSNLILDGNIVLNGVGNIEGGTHPTYAEGIYLDESAQNVTVQYNTIAGNSHSGIKLHKASNCSILNNTIYNNPYGVDYLNSTGSTGIITGQVLTGNKIISKVSDQITLMLECYSINDCINFGITANNNYYARPIDDNLTIRISEPQGWNNLKSLVTWQTYKSQDANSKKSPYAITSTDELRFEYNETSAEKTINLIEGYRDVEQNYYPGTITLQPYTSVVLFKGKYKAQKVGTKYQMYNGKLQVM